MRHRHSRRRLRQKPAHARLLERNLITSLLLYEEVRTTKKRAEVIRPIVERLITAARTKNPMNAIRALNRVVMDRNASHKVMEVYLQRFASRPSGLLRIVPLGRRRGDGAQLVTVTFVDRESAATMSEGEATAGGRGERVTTVRA